MDHKDKFYFACADVPPTPSKVLPNGVWPKITFQTESEALHYVAKTNARKLGNSFFVVLKKKPFFLESEISRMQVFQVRLKMTIR